MPRRRPGHAQAAAERGAQASAELESQVARVEESAAGVAQHAERAERAVSAAEGHCDRASEVARQLAEAAAAAEREAERAREAAEDAERAAGHAREAAEHAVHGAYHAPDRPLVPYETGAPAAPVPAASVAGGAAPPESAPPAAAQDPHRPLFANRDTGPKREPRPGFDDVKEPRAIFALDGHFMELNQGFTDLVGYTEAEFQQAVWPPVMDRPNLPKHREQIKDLLAGKIEVAEVNTAYVHAQGLLVPLEGRITLERENGEPSHFLIVAKAG